MRLYPSLEDSIQAFPRDGRGNEITAVTTAANEVLLRDTRMFREGELKETKIAVQTHLVSAVLRINMGRSKAFSIPSFLPISPSTAHP